MRAGPLRRCASVFTVGAVLVTAGCAMQPRPASVAGGPSLSASIAVPASTVAPSTTAITRGPAPKLVLPTAPDAAAPKSAASTGPGEALRGTAAQRTPDGLWWGVDSTAPISAASLANVWGWYAGAQVPLVWGRYVDGSFALKPGELAFARVHGIYVYLLVPDRNCSACDGGRDLCGADHTAAQAAADAQISVAAAKNANVAAGAVLYKDIEQIGSCTGELTSTYLSTWLRTVRRSLYRVGFYGNAYRPNYDFPMAYCAMIQASPALAREVVLADDEPEPAIGAPSESVGPRNAPVFAPDQPSCAPTGATKIWQYGESLSRANVTDVDEIRSDTPGLIAPTGAVT